MIHVSASARSYPALPYGEIARTVLGERYELSLTFIGRERAQALNREHRKKAYVPNVLSFPLTATAGEVYICPEVAKRQAKKFSMTYRGYVGLLFIHGLLHLKGHLHDATMERAEQAYVRRFGLK